MLIMRDINQDGYVNSVDFGIMMSDWYNPLPIGLTSYQSIGNSVGSNVSSETGPLSSQENQPSFTLFPVVSGVKIGESVDVTIYMDTGGQDAVVAAAYLKYDPAYFRVNNVDTTGSVFTMQAEKIIDPVNGMAGITRGVITPGINTAQGKIATVNLTALFLINPVSDNLVLLFNPGSTIGSAVCEDDGLGMNNLGTVHNATVIVYSNDCYTFSSSATPSTGGSVTVNTSQSCTGGYNLWTPISLTAAPAAN